MLTVCDRHHTWSDMHNLVTTVILQAGVFIHIVQMKKPRPKWWVYNLTFMNPKPCLSFYYIAKFSHEISYSLSYQSLGYWLSKYFKAIQTHL